MLVTIVNGMMSCYFSISIPNNVLTGWLTVNSLERLVQQEKYREAIDSFPFIALNPILIAALCAFTAQYLFHSSNLPIAWFLALVTVVIIRVVHLQQIKIMLTKGEPLPWLDLYYGVGAGLMGLTWGIGTVLVFRHGDTPSQLPSLVIAAGLAHSGFAYLVNSRTGYLAYFWALYLPIIFYTTFIAPNLFLSFTLTLSGLFYTGLYGEKIHSNAMQSIRQGIERDIALSELHKANKQIQQMSETDYLTGLRNRSSYVGLFKDYWQLAIDKQLPIAVILIDIDHFKAFNDHYGHLQGDQALKSIAQVIRNMLPKSGIAGRFGGEEFIVILPGYDSVKAERSAEIIRGMIEQQGLSHDVSPTANIITASFGVSSVIPLEGQDYKSVVALADKALYQAKENGRNRVVAAA